MTKEPHPAASRIEAMRDLDRWNRPLHAHACLDDFLATRSLRDGIHAIAYCGVYLELNLHRRPSKALLIFFHAALSSRDVDFRLPVFSGSSALNETDANVLMVSDPALYLGDDIRLAWYAGAATMPLQRDLGRVLRHIQDVLVVERTVLYGASGGGFAALYFAPFLRDAIAVPCNPQIDLLAYSQGLVAKYLETAFGYRGKPSAFESASISGKPVMRLRASHMGNTRILYLQNITDRRHVERHLLFFLEDFGFKRNDELIEAHSDRLVTVCSDAWGEGHRAAPASFIFPLLHNLTEANGWVRLPSLLAELHARTASPFRQVSLSLESGRFTASARLHEALPERELTLSLIRNAVEIEVVRARDGDLCRFATKPTQGSYWVAARLERDASPRSWGGRALRWFGRGKVFDEMKSRVMILE